MKLEERIYREFMAMSPARLQNNRQYQSEQRQLARYEARKQQRAQRVAADWRYDYDASNFEED